MGILKRLFGSKSSHDPSAPIARTKDLREFVRLINVESRNGNLGAVKAISADVVAAGLPAHLKPDFLALGLFEAASEGHADVVRFLVAEGANVDRPHDKTGGTALQIAAFTNRETVVAILASAGANVNAKDNTGTTPFMIAAGRCSKETVLFLLKHGADVGMATSKGVTAHTFAETNVNPEIVRLLDTYLSK